MQPIHIVETLPKVHHTIKVMIKFCLLILLALNFTNVKSQNSITGCYSSNFAIIGWFGTHIKINEDKSFEYLFAGDLFYDKTYGTLDLNKNLIILNFNKNTDSLEISLRDSTGNITAYKFPAPENNAAQNRPSKLKIKKDRLIIYDRNGKRVRRKMNSRERWQKYYLVKHQCD